MAQSNRSSFRSSRRRVMSEINVVPYIDVMLVLLVIFMVTASAVNPGIVNLPTVGGAKTQALPPIFLNIDAKENITVRSEGAPTQSLTALELGVLPVLKPKNRLINQSFSLPINQLNMR